LLEVAIGGERLRQSVLLHDREREAIRQALAFVGAASIKVHRGSAELGLKLHDLDSPVGVNATIAFRRDCPRARVRRGR
jgi:hypothetical protein